MLVNATIERRLLLNYRVDPDVLAGLLPGPFRPQVVAGYGLAGVCLIRLGGVGPAGVPAWLGVRSENAAHRIAVEWDGENGPERGVFILRRDSASWVTTVAGGRLFPGWHHRASFAVDEGSDGSYRIAFTGRDGAVRVAVTARRSPVVMAGSVFATVEEASLFFRGAPDGYAVTPDPTVLDGVSLATDGWSFAPLAVESAAATWYDDEQRFPPGSIALDSAFVMTGLASRWRPLPPRAVTAPASLPAPSPPHRGGRDRSPAPAARS